MIGEEIGRGREERKRGGKGKGSEGRGTTRGRYGMGGKGRE